MEAVPNSPRHDRDGKIATLNGPLNPVQHPHRNRACSIALVIFVAVLGLGSRRLDAYLPDAVATYTGDTLWALAVFLGLGLCFPAVATRWTALMALVISCLVELSQLYHAPWIDSIRGNVIAHLVLGSGFDPIDLACYTVGVGIGVLKEKLMMSRNSSARSRA
jgi:Protein of unknown function (DUF2809)